MTQELIANMLGVRREGVTDATGKLQKLGAIEYRRGRITVLNRPQLERLSCKCYGVVKKQTHRLLPVRRPSEPTLLGTRAQARVFDGAPTAARNEPRLPHVVSQMGPIYMKFGQGPLGRVFSLEHSRAAYLADFALLYASIAALAAFLVVRSAPGRRAEIAVLAIVGLAGWTLIEYVLHRFVLHGLQPFRRWHALHHLRQTDLIYAPSILSVSAVTGLALMSGWVLGDLSRACALTLGLLIGYVGYSITHHAVHHWSGGNAWLRRRKRWHSLHHRSSQPPGRYGVTTAVWDHVFRSAVRVPARRFRIPRQIAPALK